jgi:hypothetical protein
MDSFILDPPPEEAFFPFLREYDPFLLPRGGSGYLAGTLPNGVTRVGGTATSATVRVLLRTEKGHPGDGALIDEVVSESNGVWRVEGLPVGMKFDVVGRKDGYNDVIAAGITPATE